ncbi:MAG TPA: Mur ligase family protein [Candidatus Saccharimonadales bacterium]|nr:Mur ligase family protein [Candidatus Saccharimonadales bacterium]
MIDSLLITLGKAISKLSKAANRGNGSTWPGHIALKGNPQFIKDILRNSNIKTIIVAGTNGKTTTSSLIRRGLEQNGKKVIQNNSGANLLNGVASTLLLNSNRHGKLNYDYAIFEIDENALPGVLAQITPDYLVLLNLFRDQLDRYGEINTIVQKWHDAINKINGKTKLVLNADDPQIAYIGLTNKLETEYFGLEANKTEKIPVAADTISCPKCGNKLTFENVIFSHLGSWHCTYCGLKRPKPQQTTWNNYPLSGTYNKYNVHAAVAVLKQTGLKENEIENAFRNFKPAFGRQEIIAYKDRQVQIFLSKNPTSFNESYKTIKELHATTLLIVLNDRIPDGRDISWIWDTDFPELEKFDHIFVAGDRVYDMALRLKYELENMTKIKTFEDLDEAITSAIDTLPKDKTLYILPTYSAMLDVRKLLTGKKIL